MGKAVLGREAEFGAVERFLERMRTEQAALVVEGEAGIGKTTVWLQAVQQAEARAFRVLQARPAESEAQHSYAALADLLANVFDELRVALPAIQEGALAAALLRAGPDAVAEPRTTATGFVGILTGLAEQGPVVVAIDDAQWLDSASEAALVFAARRLPPRLGLLITRRTQGRVELPLGLGRALPEDRVERVVPGPLSLAGLHELVDDRLGWSLPRPLLARLADASGGNPFFALEISRDLAEDGGRHAAGEPLPVPPSLEELVATRVDGLSEAARQAVLVAAALSRPTTAAIADALQSEELMRAALVEAEEAGVLVSDGDRIRFAHPLLASAAYGAASPERRRQLHERLAAVVPDPEERARHLALSATGADETIAAEIEQAAQQAAKRGAQQAAAELYQASRRLTPDERGDELARRELGQASALLAGGDIDGARALAERAAESPAAALRAEALYLLAEILWIAGTFQGASEHLQQALAAAPDDPQLAARVYPRLVYVHAAHDPARASKLVDVAVDALDPERSPAALASVLVNQFWVELMLGESARPELLEQWRELEERAGPDAPKSLVPLIYFHSVDDFAAARARHAVEDEWYRVRGEDDWRAERQAHRAFAEFRAGEWDEAERLVEEACSVIAKSERPGPWTMAFRFRALVDAGRGRTGRARATLLPLIEEAERSARFWWEALLLSALAFVEFTAGDHRAVDRALTRMRECLDAIGTRDMIPDRSEPFHVESLVALGEPSRARAVLERLEERGRVFPRLWTTATLPRTRALVLAAEGDVSGALGALAELDPAAASQLPLDHGWTLLVQGRLLRRARKRRASAQSLQQALEIFERLGAPDWAQRARDELERVGLRRASSELTATELRVAELAAAGLTNREVAAKAFMSPKTVEANLARVYRKLGIRSRAELGVRIDGARTPPTRPAEPRVAGGRELATILFTDLVSSTEKVRALGDAAWATLLAEHNVTVRRELSRFSGEEIDTAGDGFLAVFDAPALAITCAIAIRDGLRALHLEVRAGVHTGEVERRPEEKPRGIAIHACARIMALAGAGEILVSSTTRDLVDGSGLEFEDRGEHELKGIGAARRVFAAG